MIPPRSLAMGVGAGIVYVCVPLLGAARGRAEFRLCWILPVSTPSAARRRGAREKCKKDAVRAQITALISRYTLVARAHTVQLRCCRCHAIRAPRAFQNSHQPKSNTKEAEKETERDRYTLAEKRGRAI